MRTKFNTPLSGQSGTTSNTDRNFLIYVIKNCSLLRCLPVSSEYSGIMLKAAFKQASAKIYNKMFDNGVEKIFLILLPCPKQ